MFSYIVSNKSRFVQYWCLFVQGPVYEAMYDYDAQDDDEVSFIEGDTVINCQVVDDGWVIGTVQRTNQKGMIPSNYIQLAQ